MAIGDNKKKKKNEVGIRKFLNKQGISDGPIGYRSEDKTVTVGGKDFFSNAETRGGRTYADRSALQSALKKFRQKKSQQGTTQNNETDPLKQKRDKAVNMMMNKVSQPIDPFSYNKETDPAFQAAVKAAQSNTEKATNNALVQLGNRGIANSSIAVDRANQLQQNAQARLTNKIAPRLRDQAYQKYITQQELGQKQINNLANVASTLSGARRDDTLNQLTNKQIEGAGITNQMNQTKLEYLPESLEAEQDLTQAQIEGEKLGNEGQRMLNQMNEMKLDYLPEQLRAGMQQMYTDIALGQLDVRTAKEELDRLLDPNSIANQTAKLQLETAAINRDIASINRDFLPQQQQAELNQIQANIDRINRANVTTEAEAEEQQLRIQTMREKLNQMKNPTNTEEMQAFQQERKGLVTALRNGQMTPQQAITQIQQDTQIGFYTPQQAQDLIKIVSTVAPTTPEPEQTPEQQEAQQSYMNNLPPDEQIHQEARQQGYPILGYEKWYKDPKGRAAGMTFEQWHQLYGPRLTSG